MLAKPSMPADAAIDPKFEIGHVLFIDIVGYSKLLIGEQSELVRQLREIVARSEQVRLAGEQGKLVSLPTGDGVVLVFRNGAEAPAQCAIELARAINDYPQLRVRMGIHSGPVNVVNDVNNRANVAGAGINIAQRVMDCGDAGHILLSKHVAEDLEHYARWRPYLHDLGECEVKHGTRVLLVNFYSDSIGNSEIPGKVRQATRERTMAARRGRNRILFGTSIAVVAVLGIGYWFLHRNQTSDSAAIPVKSIAVLPFQNLSPEPQNAFFADGVQDEILTNLARIADLKVISRTSVMQYKAGITRNARAIGQALGVANLLEGSVQRAGGKVRVNAQLIDARNDTHLWAQTYDRDLADIFAIQSEIAKTIADQLQAKLSPREKAEIEQAPTTDVAAFDLYSHAKTLTLSIAFSAAHRKMLLEAADLLDQALARDPSFFQAYCLLADTHAALYSLGIDRRPERLTMAQKALDAAARLQPDAGEVHLVRAQYLFRSHLDYGGALRELQVAGETLPNSPRLFELTGYIRRRQGYLEEGLENFKRALELDPGNIAILHQTAISYYLLRRYSDVIAVLDRALTIRPDDVETQVTRASAELSWKADTRPMHRVIDSIRKNDPAKLPSIADTWFVSALAERNPNDAESALVALGDGTFGTNSVQLSRRFGEGLLARMTKDDARARAAFMAARLEQEKVVTAQPDYGPAFCVLGLIDAGLGNKEEALREGRRAIELLPVNKDAINGANMIEYFAIVAAWVGEKELACEQLEATIRLPAGWFSSYGQLKLSPVWDPLRGDPRFEKIVASLAPNS